MIPVPGMAFAALTLLVAGSAMWAPWQDGRGKAPPPPHVGERHPDGPPQDDGAPRGEGTSRADGPRRGGRPMLTPEMFEEVIAVGMDVSPEFGKQLEGLRKLSPEQKMQAMRQNAPRLLSLAFLKERNRKLYDARVGELRVQLELHALGEQYVTAERAGDTAAMNALLPEIQKKVRQQVDMDQRAKAIELKALDEQLAKLKKELEEDIARTDERVAERVEAVKKGQPVGGRRRDGERNGDRGGRDAPGRSD